LFYIQAFAGHFVLETYQAGVKVVEQGAVADSFFVLANGAVEIYVRGDAQSMTNDTSKSESWDKSTEDADGVVRLESIRVRSQSKFQSEVSQQLAREMVNFQCLSFCFFQSLISTSPLRMCLSIHFDPVTSLAPMHCVPAHRLVRPPSSPLSRRWCCDCLELNSISSWHHIRNDVRV
jgi:hypothetical protein